MKHYCCIGCYFPQSRMIRHCDIVEFVPHPMPFLRVKLKDYLMQSADDIIFLLTYLPSKITLLLEARDPV